MKTRSLIIIAVVLLVGCKNNTDKADAFGNFEATEVIVSSETNGRILQFDAKEGSILEKGSELALIDTILLNLQKREINASINSVKTKIGLVLALGDEKYRTYDYRIIAGLTYLWKI